MYKIILDRQASFLCFSFLKFYWPSLFQMVKGELNWFFSLTQFELRKRENWPSSFQLWCVFVWSKLWLDEWTLLGSLRWRFWFEVFCLRAYLMSNPKRNRVWVLHLIKVHICSFFWEGQHLRTIFWGLFIIKWGALWRPFWIWRE